MLYEVITTAMISQILNTAGLDPTVIIGGLLQGLNTNALHGSGEFIVAEADESDGSFLKYAPSIAAVTNIDLEHLDFYKDIEDIKNNFVQFINSVPFYGLAILCLDDPHIQDILPRITVRHITYGMTAQSELQARHIVITSYSIHYTKLYDFRYITFRTIYGGLTAFIICVVLGPFVIRQLQVMHFGQIIQTDGPQSHLKKQGTPTMGGIMILFSIFVSTFLWGNFTNPYVGILLLTTLLFGAIGFFDDYRNSFV